MKAREKKDVNKSGNCLMLVFFFSFFNIKKINCLHLKYLLHKNVGGRTFGKDSKKYIVKQCTMNILKILIKQST